MWLQQNFLSMTITPFSFCNWLFSMSVKCKLAQSGSPVIWWKFSFFSKSSINKTKFWTFTKVFSSGGNLCFWRFRYSVWGCIRVNNDRTQQQKMTDRATENTKKQKNRGRMSHPNQSCQALLPFHPDNASPFKVKTSPLTNQHFLPD